MKQSASSDGDSHSSSLFERQEKRRQKKPQKGRAAKQERIATSPDAPQEAAIKMAFFICRISFLCLLLLPLPHPPLRQEKANHQPNKTQQTFTFSSRFLLLFVFAAVILRCVWSIHVFLSHCFCLSSLSFSSLRLGFASLPSRAPFSLIAFGCCCTIATRTLCLSDRR